MSECDHKFVFRSSRTSAEYAGFNTRWLRIDFYFCERCLEERQKRSDATSRDAPDWYFEVKP